MDFDSDLVQIQGALLKANNTHLFKYLSSRGGNEKEIKNIVDILTTQLSTKNYIDEKGINRKFENTMRKISLYLIFNTDLKILDDLANSDDVGHLVWTTPILTKCLLIHTIWGLNLDEFYCEAVQYTCPNLSLDLLRIANQNMRYSSPEASLKRVNNLVNAAYGMTYNLLTHQVRDSQKNILEEVLDITRELMKYFVDSPNKSKMDNWDIDKLYLYAGYALLNLFDLLIKCFTIFIDRNQDVCNKDLDIYSFTYVEDNSDESPEKIDNMDDIIEDYLNKYNELLIDITKQNVMSVSIDIYCSWSENDSENDPDKTLQQEIGELAHKLHCIMEKDKRFDSELIPMLIPISCKPIELSDIIKAADKDTITKKAGESTENQKEWLSALSKRDFLFSDEDSIACVIKNVHLLSDNDRTELFKSSIDCIYNKLKMEFTSEIKTLALTCLNKLNVENQKSIVKIVFSDKEFGHKLELDNFDSEMTEFFNKLIDFNDSLKSTLVRIFVQNPHKFYAKAFELASKNSKASSIYDALDFCKEFHDIVDEMWIVNALSELRIQTYNTDFEKQSFILFIGEIYTRKIIGSETIFLEYIMPSINKHLTSRNLSYTLMYLQCLKEIYDKDKFVIEISPMIVLFGQILESIRWDLNNFSTNSVDVIDIVVKLLRVILDDFIKSHQPTDLEWRWILEKIVFLTPLNAIYFKNLLNDNAKDILDVSSNNFENLQQCLSYLLPRSTLDEIKKIFTKISSEQTVDKCFILFCEIIKLIIIKAKEINSVSSYACLEHCCRNFAITMEDASIFESVVDHYTILRETVSLLNLIPRAIYDEVFNCFLQLASRILKMSKDNSVSAENVIKIIDDLKSDASKSILKQVLELETES